MAPGKRYKQKKWTIDLEAGLAKATIDPTGTWMISFVKMISDPIKATATGKLLGQRNMGNMIINNE